MKYFTGKQLTVFLFIAQNMAKEETEKLKGRIEHFYNCAEQYVELKKTELLLEQEMNKTAKEIFTIKKGKNAEIPEPEIYRINGKKYMVSFVSQMFFNLIRWRENIKIVKIK